MPKLTQYFRDGYALQINYTINSQNIIKNTTNITFQAQLVSGGADYTIISKLSKNGSLTINGTVYSFTFMADLAARQEKTLYTKTLDIPHNSDGTKTLSLKMDIELYVYLSNVLWTDISFPTSLKLSNIPRASTMSLSTSSATLGGTAVTVNISRASNSFTHKVYCKIGSYNQQINVDNEGATSIVFTPDKSIANQLPTSTSGTATIEVQTYTLGVKLGSVTNSITLQVPTYMVPSIESFKATPVAAGAAASYGYVKGLSKCCLTMGTVKGSYGSSIKSYSISGGGFSSTSTSFTTEILNNAGGITFTAKVTDSRGRTATATALITVYDYTIPKINTFTAQRCSIDGSLTDEGTYINIKTSYIYSSVNNQNAVTTSIQYKKSTDSTWSDGGSISSDTSKIIGSGLISIDNLFDVIITVSDNFKSVSKTISVSTSYAIIDILKGGKGVAIGKFAEKTGVLDVGMDLQVLGTGKTQIKNTAKSVSWLTGCKGEGAIINMVDQNGHTPILRQKTTNGAWTLGVYNNDIMYLTYMTDANINSGSNVVTAQYAFPANVIGTVSTTGSKSLESDALVSDTDICSQPETYSTNNLSLSSNTEKVITVESLMSEIEALKNEIQSIKTKLNLS